MVFGAARLPPDHLPMPKPLPPGPPSPALSVLLEQPELLSKHLIIFGLPFYLALATGVDKAAYPGSGWVILDATKFRNDCREWLHKIFIFCICITLNLCYAVFIPAAEMVKTASASGSSLRHWPPGTNS